MLILYVAIKHDYGKPEQGFSFEHYNFYDTLCNMGNDILYFDPYALMVKYGRERMNRRLHDVVYSEKPDCLFCVLFGDELDRIKMRDISENSGTVSMNWFCDDHWRFDNFSKFWAPSFNWSITTAESALPKYAKMRYSKVIKSQWACNHFLYRKLPLPIQYKVSFVGKPHSYRASMVDRLTSDGIDIRAWGSGWKSGRLSQDEMINVFNTSSINLNFSGSEVPILSPIRIFKLNSRRRILEAFDGIPMGKAIKRIGKKIVRSIRFDKDPVKTRKKAVTPSHDDATYSAQIKGRIFEIPGCGGFMLTEPADNLESYYKIGKEIVCFSGEKDLEEKIRYYLGNEKERQQIADAGYRRTLNEHTYVHRFNHIFRQTGLSSKSESREHPQKNTRGTTVEID